MIICTIRHFLCRTVTMPGPTPRRLFLILLQSHFLLLFLLRHSNSIVDAKYTPSDPIELFGSAYPKYSVEFPAPVSFFVEASQGGYPLLGLKVRAHLQRPNRVTPLPLLLRDDGRLADKSQKDGIYSARFVDYTAKGRYSYSFVVHGIRWRGGRLGCRNK